MPQIIEASPSLFQWSGKRNLAFLSTGVSLQLWAPRGAPTLTSAVSTGLCFKKQTLPAEPDLMCTRKMTSPPLVFGVFRKAAVKDSLFPDALFLPKVVVLPLER